MPQEIKKPNFFITSLSRHFVWWAVIITILILVAGGWWLLKPLYFKWSSLSNADVIQNQLANYQTTFDQVKSQVQVWQKLKQERGNQLELILPTNLDLPNLLAELEAVVGFSGFKLQAININEGSGRGSKNAKLGGGVRVARISLNLEGGSYAAFKKLLQTVSNAGRILSVESFGFSGQESSYRLELATYYYSR